MSDDRRILNAKRQDERDSNRSRNKTQDTCKFKQGTKRCKKNLANDRLQRLRSTLNEEMKSALLRAAKVQNKLTRGAGNKSRKRSNPSPAPAVSVKMPKREAQSSESAFVAPEVLEISHEVQRVSDDTEAMEWSFTEDVDLDRTSDASTSTTNFHNTTPLNLTKVSPYKNKFLIVVDTNIFLSHLRLIKNVITMPITGNREPVIFIPWIVIEELDFIKDDLSKTYLVCNAQEAVKYIDTTLSNKHTRMLGQSLKEVNEQKFAGNGQDNKVLACCLQLQEQCEDMILLTNDINLRNKAHLNNVPVCSHSEMMSKILHKLNPPKAVSKSQRILEKTTALCGLVIRECAKNAYGVACSEMPICRSPPKTLQECISLFTRYWGPVFREFLMKQFNKSLKDLSSFLRKNEVVKDGTKELDELLRLCVRVCLFLKDVESCRNAIENTIRDLNDIKDS